MLVATLFIQPKGNPTPDSVLLSECKRSFRDGDFSYIYSSDVPGAICLGHYFLDGLSEEQRAQKNLFIVSVDDNNCAVVLIQNKLLSQKVMFPADVLSKNEYDLESAENIWITDELANLVSGPTLPIVHEWKELATKKYRVTKKKNFSIKHIAAAILVLAGGYKAYDYFFNSPVITAAPAPTYDPWDTWRSAVTQQYKADITLAEAAKLYSYGLLLPTKWVFKSLAFKSGALSLSTEREEGATHADWQAYLRENPALTHFSKGDLNSRTLTVPMERFNDNSSIHDITGKSPDLYDALIRLGAQRDIVVVTEKLNQYTEHRYSLKLGDVNYAILHFLSELLRDRPVFITQLTIKPKNSDKQIISELSLNLTMQGVSNE